MMDDKIKEAYVSFEVAKLLKEKGFTEECEYFYDWYKDSGFYHICSNGGTCNSEAYPDEYSMPTQQMAMAWCREVHKLHIGIVRGPCGYHITIETIPLGVVKYITREITGTTYVESYEEAVEVALRYILENLI